MTSPWPTTPFATPGGSASIRSSSSKIAIDDAGASLAGLRTNVQPVAIAAPILRSGRSTGSFHGVIRPQTPTGSFSTKFEQVARGAARHLAVDQPRGARVEQDPVDRWLELALADVADRLAHLAGDELREAGRLLAEQPRELVQDRRASLAGRRRPVGLIERPSRCGDRRRQVIRRRRTRGRDELPGRRVTALERRAAGVDPARRRCSCGPRGRACPCSIIDSSGWRRSRRRPPRSPVPHRWSAAG